jgi:F0F1-type ATP synthase membrane subunit b/b'
MTEREWQRLENTMKFIVEQQAKFESNFAAADKRFARAEGRLEQAERRMDRMERYADRIIKRGERRMLQAEAEISDLRETFKSFLRAMRRSSGNGGGRS